MALDPIHHDHVHEEIATVSSTRAPFGVAQVVSLVFGIVYVVLGAIGLARTGFDQMTTDTATVGAFRVTGLLSLIFLAMGLIMLAGAADRFAARSVGMGLGALLIAAGVIALIQPVRALGWNDACGVLFLITGGSLLLGAIVTQPAVVSRSGVVGTRL